MNAFLFHLFVNRLLNTKGNTFNLLLGAHASYDETHPIGFFLDFSQKVGKTIPVVRKGNRGLEERFAKGLL
jgi:hypothetical protein